MNGKKAFPFTCKFCSQTFSKAWNRDRHVQTMHDNYKYTCDICYSQFTRLYSLNNHKKHGNCKLDLVKNPIVTVTPLGLLPNASSSDVVNSWLQPKPTPTPTARMETGSEQPSTSYTQEARPSTSTTLPRTLGARQQIRKQAATAIPPSDSDWKHRLNFSLNLPAGHQNQLPPRSGKPLRTAGTEPGRGTGNQYGFQHLFLLSTILI